MKLWHKVTVVCICGAAVWGLSYTSSLFPTYALVCSSFATGVTALCSIITGFPAKEE